MLQIAYYILFSIVFLFGLYFALLAPFAFIKRKNPIKKHDAKTKFAVLIAARNEGAVIGDLVASLTVQKYPAELYDIYVLVNNCTDQTENIARDAGAKIMCVDAPVKSKGDVLKYAFEQLKPCDYNAYIIFDADNEVHPDFLSHMNNAYQSGYLAAQGRKDSKNIEDNWLSASYSIFYYIQNFFFNKARTKINCSSAINGTGFMIDKTKVAETFDPKTLTEDVELSIICAIKDIKIAYVEDAITYDEQPVDFKTSWNQRVRWSLGIMQCGKLYRGKLLLNFFRSGDLSCIDKFMFTLGPAMQVLSFIVSVITIIFKIIGVPFQPFYTGPFSLEIIGSIVAFIAGALVNVFVIAFYKRNILKSMHGILLFGLFTTSWLPINIVCFFKIIFFKKKIEWVPVKHTSKSNINNIMTEEEKEKEKKKGKEKTKKETKKEKQKMN